MGRFFEFGLRVMFCMKNKIDPQNFTAQEPVPASQLGTIVLLFLILRLSILFFFTPQGLRFAQSDFAFYYNTMRLGDQGYYPFVNMWYEYPPLLAYFPWPAYTGAQWLAPLLATAPEPLFGKLLSLQLLVFDAGTLLLIHHVARKIWSVERANWLGWVYSGLSMPLMMLTFSHQAPAVFLLLGAAALYIDGRWRWSALVLGLAIAAKLLPVFLLAPVIRFMWPRKQRIAAAVGLTVVSAGLVYLPFLLLGGGPWIAASFRALGNGRSYATLWAMVDRNWGPGFYGSLETRLSLAAGYNLLGSPPVIPPLAALLGFGALYALLFFRALPDYNPRRFVWFATASAALFFLWLKGWSPQYALFLIPLVLLSFPNLHGLGIVLLLSAFSTTHWTESVWWMRLMILARAVLLIATAALAVHRIWPVWVGRVGSLPQAVALPVTGQEPASDQRVGNVRNQSLDEKS